MWIAVGAAFAAGLALGVVVTRNLHGNPKKRFWNVRLGRTPWRRANVPVGGAVASLVAALLYAAGRTDAAAIALGLAGGMAAGAIGVGLVDPLPRDGQA